MRQFGRLPFQNLQRGVLFWQFFCIIGKLLKQLRIGVQSVQAPHE